MAQPTDTQQTCGPRTGRERACTSNRPPRGCANTSKHQGSEPAKSSSSKSKECERGRARPLRNKSSLLLGLACLAGALSLAECALNPVLDLNDTFSYLVDPSTGRVTPPGDYMDFDNIYAPSREYRHNMTAQSRNYHLIKAFDFANYFQSDYWHYSSAEELRLSAQPVANPELCRKQLDWLLAQLSGSSREQVLFEPGEQHVNLMTLLDSFGKPDASTFSGHNLWLGSFFECSRAKVNTRKFEQEACLRRPSATQCNETTTNEHGATIAGRYCLAKARDKDWPRDDRYKPTITYKIAMCLPETCETSSVETLRPQLDALLKINMPEFWKQRVDLTDLYCLPDERSPIRQLSPAARILASLLVAWVALVLLATLVYAFYKRDEDQLEASGLHKDLLVASPSEGALDKKLGSISTLSLANWLRESPSCIKFVKALSMTENMLEFRKPPRALKDKTKTLLRRVNLNALDCIKCFCCILVILGHIIFIHMQHMTNITHTIEISNQTAPQLLISLFNFVDTFFIISGMLTAYFIFKRFDERSFGKPLLWLYIAFMRLVRLSPVYVLIFWFTKTLTVHLATGPVWDYATDRHSIKGLCRHDAWWKSLLYLGNWGTMQPLCILPAWSIIVDSQYSLLLPPFIYLFMRFRRLGYVMMLVAVVVSTANMSWHLASQQAVKHGDMANFRLHVYPLISRFAAEFYNTAFNRIGPVAIGIVGGHVLYLYDTGAIRQWPGFMRGLGLKLILGAHLLIMLMPTMAKLSEPDADSDAPKPDTDLTIFILSNAAIKPIWSLLNTALILRLVTDLRRESVLAELMAHNLWHCMGKLCFISYLIHYEIIIVLLKSRQDGPADPNWLNVGREFSFAFILTTAISYCIYILYEAPVNNLLFCAIKVQQQMAKTPKKLELADQQAGGSTSASKRASDGEPKGVELQRLEAA